VNAIGLKVLHIESWYRYNPFRNYTSSYCLHERDWCYVL